MIKYFWTAVCFWLSALAVPVLAANVLSDPGFESDTAGESQTVLGWTAYGQGVNTLNETGANAHSGNNYFKVYTGGTSSVNYSGVYQDYISGAGATYTADGWAKTLSTDAIAGGNLAWIEVTFRDANANMLALYRSSLITSSFPKNTWVHLFITNQYDPNTFTQTGNTANIVAPPGTYFVRYQVVFQGDAANSSGSVYFDDLNLNSTGSAPYGNWNIVWNDEFNGSNIDANTWTYDLGNGGWGNNELENYTSRTNNAFVANGLLHIVARQESLGGSSFTSARMKTQGLVSWQYGRFEWRAKLPGGTGFWPALWFLGTNITSVSWPGCGEMDVVENNGASPNFTQGSLHSGSDETAIYNFIDGDSVTNFHTYVLDWAPNAFLWYVDGHLYETQTGWGSSLGLPYPAPFNKPSFMVMNLAVGGNYVGNPTTQAISSNGSFPGELQVDYVRVYNPTPPLALSLIHSNNNIYVAWPSNVVGHLQAQYNTNLTGFSMTNWSDLNQTTNPSRINPTNSSAFFRLKSP